jgi:hypothetical protein
LKQEAFAIPIMLGSPYPFFLGFDGSTITFKLDNEVVVYDAQYGWWLFHYSSGWLFL